MIGYLFGREIGQSWEDLAVWEEVLNENPSVSGIFELGTYHGSMSLFLNTQADSRRIRFATFDNTEYVDWLPCNFEKIDVLEFWEFVCRRWGAEETVIVFCDGGNKKEEAKLYSQVVSDDSIIAVHDWGTEFTAANIPLGWRVYKEGGNTVFLKTEVWLNSNPGSE